MGDLPYGVFRILAMKTQTLTVPASRLLFVTASMSTFARLAAKESAIRCDNSDVLVKGE
jgi:hypothetical protein